MAVPLEKSSLQKELGSKEWPFSENHVLARDPKPAEITRMSPLHWLA
ncbi:hypothetical protein JOF56_008870 [Kibdelosporangium banguiense]|uniref:Uncharacterized protein n=1 Tax=Kibdelosporangium banguiense TaxID=1365924 RepID=A0ABS4TVR3_9PSEU|nr:hypothetical protein [Kibdelosporangium banguiense]MBP2328485.1 hypothetical protein [Kibdelosporangium banguiense]